MKAIADLRRKLGLNRAQFAVDLDLPIDTIKRAELGHQVTASEWTDLEAALGAYLTPERIRAAGITQDAVDDLLEQLPFCWREAADREMLGAS